MLRADYCGDGTSWTFNGNLVNVYDNVGIQKDSENWYHEAVWTPSGAACMSPGVYRLNMPTCYDKLVSQSCDNVSHFQSGGLLMSEINRPRLSDNTMAGHTDLTN
jgi:hypothetical protein